MKLKAAPALIDTCALAAASHEGAHTEALFHEVDSVIGLEPEEMEASLSRLEGGGFLESYDWPRDGKKQRFYRIAAAGRCRLEQNLGEWGDYVRRVDAFLRPRKEPSQAAQPGRGENGPPRQTKNRED